MILLITDGALDGFEKLLCLCVWWSMRDTEIVHLNLRTHLSILDAFQEALGKTKFCFNDRDFLFAKSHSLRRLLFSHYRLSKTILPLGEIYKPMNNL